MCYINVKEQFDVRFTIKALIFSRQGFNTVQARSVLGPHILSFTSASYALIFRDNFHCIEYNIHCMEGR